MPAQHRHRFFLPLTDAYGGRGGIAAFNRHLLEAVCCWEGSEAVVAVPVRAEMLEVTAALPEKLTYVPPVAASGRVAFLLRTLRTWLRHRPFDVVLCGHLYLLRSASLVRVLSRASMACVIHGIDAWAPPPRRSIRALVGVPDRFLSVSQFTWERFLSWSGVDVAKGSILPNCVDLERFTPGPAAPELVAKYDLEGRRVILTLARLDANERYKGIDEVLDALPVLLRTAPNLTYVVAGSGSDLGRLRTKTSDMGLTDRVRFIGYVPEEQKQAHYRLADAFVMPGRGEGFGIVYLEAMACGIPVVASSADASREAVRNGQLGALADPDDPASVHDAILEALEVGKGTRPDGLDDFSRQAFHTRVHDFLGDWLGDADRRPTQG